MDRITPPPPSFLTDMQQQQQQQQQHKPLAAPSSCSSSSLCPSSALGSISFCPSSSSPPSFSSSSSSSSPHTHFDSSSTLHAMLFLDVTTVHGLLLYTVYLLHRLRFFRWRDAKAISTLLCRHLPLARLLSHTHYPDPSAAIEQPKDRLPSAQDSKPCSEEESLSLLLDQGVQIHDPWESGPAPTTKQSISINDKLPAEIMILIFGYLSSSRILQCMLVCRSWYQLLGPSVWRNPRVLWSRHWSRFYPILSIPNTTTSCYSSPSSSSLSSVSTPVLARDTDEDIDMTSSLVSSGELFTDRAMAGIHELDRQEIERWIDWKRRDKTRRRRTIKRRRILKQRQQSIQPNSSLWGIGSGRADHRRRISDLEANHGTDNDGNRSRRRQRIHPNDSSDESEEEDDREHISFGNHHQRSRRDDDEDLDDDSGTDSDYDPSDDETALLKVVQGIDYIQSFLQRQNQPATQKSPSSTSSPSYFPLSRTLARLRRKQTTKESRLRMLHLCRKDGLPHAFPLVACGQWIQVINLQQETPYPQRTSPQSLVHPSTPQPRARPRPAVVGTGRLGQQGENIHGLAQLHGQQQGPLSAPTPPPPQQPVADRPGFFSSLFGTDRFFQQPPELPQVPTNETRTMDPVEQPRLQSRRDYVTDRTLATILKHCPGLCRLLVSECTGITDRGLELIRRSECVRRGTLVSLHMAGCFKITDKGLLILATGCSWDDNTEMEDAPATGTLRLESLDFAGCFQISDKGLIPLLKACGTRLEQLRVSDCDLVTSQSVEVLAQWCPHTEWLDLARSGPLTGSCLSLLARRCLGLEWLNLARSHPDEGGDKSNEEAVPQGSTALEASMGLEGEGEAGPDEDAISDECIGLICASCPQLQLLDLSYIPTITNAAIEAMSQTANALVCLTIIGCPGITSLSLVYLAKLRNTSGRLGCITMGDAQGISERDIEQIMQGTLSGWQKSLVDETSLGEIFGRSWDE